ncbi:MAG TPA: amidohydrolase family protein, partial [Jatrophihabitans sp.]
PFAQHPTFLKLAELPLPELVVELRKPEVKQQILGEKTGYLEDVPFYYDVAHGFDKIYPLGDNPEYEPAPEDSMAARAKQAGRDPYEFTYDELLEREGKALLFMAVSEYSDHSLDPLWERMQRDDCVVSLSDAGAHARSICDASSTTYLLTHWARDRKRGPKLSLEYVVKLQAHDTARLYGFLDRGVIKPGYRADLNVIDFEGLRLHAPEMTYDLPGGGARLLQPVDGYRASVVAGEITFENGRHTGALPGKLLRGPQPAPAGV